MSETDRTGQPNEKNAAGGSAKLAFSMMNEAGAPEPSTISSGGSAGREGKYLTFSLADEAYGIGILKIKEIIGMMPITSVPRTPAYVKGVINLRGKVIPIIDLRLRFQMEEKAYNDRSCIVVVETGADVMATILGIVVDAVSEVLYIKNDLIEDTPAFSTTLDTSYILGMAKMEADVKILLDIDAVLSSAEMTFLQTAA